jgi:hypothetical protein
MNFILKLKSANNYFLSKKYTSILLPFVGTLFQAVLWVFLLFFGIKYHKNETVQTALYPIAIFWYCIPLLSLYGVGIAIYQLENKIKFSIYTLGLLLNIGWFLFFLLFCIGLFTGQFVT